MYLKLRVHSKNKDLLWTNVTVFVCTFLMNSHFARVVEESEHPEQNLWITPDVLQTANQVTLFPSVSLPLPI